MQAFQGSSFSKQKTFVSKVAAFLPSYGNTIIPQQVTEKHVRSWQAHLERISDFLLHANLNIRRQFQNLSTITFSMFTSVINVSPNALLVIAVFDHFYTRNFSW
jgi:hypothetical protein